MVCDWSKLSGSVVGQRYVLGEIIAEREDSATFATELPETKVAAAEVIPGNSQGADVQLHCWSVARGLAHPHLVRIHDSGEETLNHGRFIYAVKERPDECLADVLVTRALTVNEARQLVEASLLCLEYLHQNAYAHGGVGPSNIVAVDGLVKLGADTVAPSTRSGFPAARDMYSLGATIVEVLTRKRLGLEFLAAPPERNPILIALPSPFREIAIGCLQPDEAQRWTPDQALRTLSNDAVQPNNAPHGRRVVTALVASASVICLVTLIGIAQRPGDTLKRAYDGSHDDRPSPIPQRGTADRTAPSKQVNGTAAVAPALATPKDHGSDWGVIVATYRDFDIAQRFADAMQGQLTGASCRVSPPRGQADKYYYVVLGSGLSKEAAQGLQERAIAAGLPKSSYVTKITESQLRRH